MKKITLSSLKQVLVHPSFFKVAGIVIVLMLVLKHFSNHLAISPAKQVLVPIVTEISATWYAPVLRVSGVTKPLNHGVVKANYKAMVQKILIQKGQRVKKGDVIMVLSSHEIEKRFSEIQARYKHKLAEYESAKKLTQKAFKSENTFLEIQANLEEAVAKLHKAQTDTEELTLVASEDGHLEDCFVHEGDTVFRQDKLVKIVYNGASQVRVFVGEDKVSTLKVGMKASVKLGDENYNAQITGLSNFADPETRNFYVDLTIEKTSDELSYGATAEVVISLPMRKGFWINASSLTMDDEGIVGIKILENELVKFIPIKLSAFNEKGAYIECDASTLALIAYGGEFLLPGQKPKVHWQKSEIL